MPTNIGDSYRVSYGDLRAALQARTGMSGPARSKALSRLTDGWLLELAADAGVTVGGVELVAVGGYGRGELSPHSDVDLILLHSSETPPAYAGMIAEKLWYPIWDSPVRLDHAVRSVGGARRLAGEDLADLLGVLDLRHLAGDAELGNALRAKVLADWRADARRRLPELLELCRTRWDSSGDLAFATTGDLKNSRGGLRDMVVMRAVAASWVADCPHAGLEEARAELLQIRDAVHSVAGRATDRLQPQDHDAIAERLGLSDRDELLRRVASIGRTVGHAIDLTWHRVKRALDGNGSRTARSERFPLADGVVEQDGEAVLARAADPANDPTLPLRLAAAAAQAGLPVAPATLARLARTSPALPVPWPPGALAELVRLLGAGPGLITVWESLDQVGLVSGLLPGWERLRSMPQRDPVHRFTVDRHLVQTAVEAGRLVRTVARPDLLLIGALLHDIGKGTGRDHSIAGAELAADVCRTLGLNGSDTAVIVTLIRHHLLLAETAIGRDPDDPATIAAIVDAVGDPGVLDLLEALTEADALAAGPGAWSTWKARQVAVLAAKVRAVMHGWIPPGIEPLDVDQQTLIDRASATGQPQVLVQPGADDVRVLLAAPDRPGLLAAVAAGLRALRLTVRAVVVRTEAPRAEAAGTEAARTIGVEPDNHGWNRDVEPGGGAGSGRNMPLCPDRAMALQTWHVGPEFGVPPDPQTLRSAVLAAAGNTMRSPVISGRTERQRAPRASTDRQGDRSFGSRRNAPVGPPPPTVRVIEGAAARATVLEIRAHDAPGLLHRAAAVIEDAGVSVTRATANTWGAEAVDVLYLQDLDGAILPPARAAELAGRVAAVLAGTRQPPQPG